MFLRNLICCLLMICLKLSNASESQPAHMLLVMGKLSSNIEVAVSRLPDVVAIMNQKTCTIILGDVRPVMAEMYLDSVSIPYVYEPNEYLVESPLATVSLSPSYWELLRAMRQTTVGSGSSDYNPPNNASLMKAFVLDTGVELNHVAFGGRATRLIGFKDQPPCIGSQHGSWVAGILGGLVMGYAQGIQIIDVKLPDGDSCVFTTCDAIMAMTYIANHAPAPPFFMVMSWSTVNGISVTINALASILKSRGGVLVAAAGNVGLLDGACQQSPASSTAVVSVGATDQSDTRAYFSNYGRCVAGFAPGVDIIGAGSTSLTVRNSGSGTSASTPGVVGMLAIIAQECGLTRPSDIENMGIAIAIPNIVIDAPGTANYLFNLAKLHQFCLNGAILSMPSTSSSSSSSSVVPTTSRTSSSTTRTTAPTVTTSSTRSTSMASSTRALTTSSSSSRTSSTTSSTSRTSSPHTSTSTSRTSSSRASTSVTATSSSARTVRSTSSSALTSTRATSRISTAITTSTSSSSPATPNVINQGGRLTSSFRLFA